MKRTISTHARSHRPLWLMVMMAILVAAVIATVPVFAASSSNPSEQSARVADTQTDSPDAEHPATDNARPFVDPSAGPTDRSAKCRNSQGPKCGQFEWDRPEPLTPMTVDIEVLTDSPRVGKPVQFDVRVHDDREQIDRECVGGTYGDGLGEPGSCSWGICQARYGLWVPPTPQRDDYEHVFEHVYTEPGTYVVTFKFVTRPTVCASPYENHGEASVEMTVR